MGFARERRRRGRGRAGRKAAGARHARGRGGDGLIGDGERPRGLERADRRVARARGAALHALLGICYGHQLLAHALGGEVARNPRGREIGTVVVRRLAPRSAIRCSASGVSEPAHVTHLESVLALPAGAVRLAESDLDPVQASRSGARRACSSIPSSTRRPRAPTSPRAATRYTPRGSTPTRCSRTSATRRAAGLLRRFAELIRRAARAVVRCHPHQETPWPRSTTTPMPTHRALRPDRRRRRLRQPGPLAA